MIYGVGFYLNATRARSGREEYEDVQELSNTRRFFEEMLPKALHMNRTLFNVLSGSICIAVQDEGAWTVRFGHYGEGCFTEELDEGADCIMLWEAASFEKMLLQQPLGPEDEPKCYGNPEMVGAFMRMLREPAKGALGVRSAGF